MSRLEQLHQFLQEDPGDPFNIYALALEYQKSDAAKAKELFDQLLQYHATYLPTYYHAGNLYLKLEMEETARQIFERGVVEARRQNEFKAMRELQSASDELN